MKLKIALTAVALVVAPSLALAEGCSHSKKQAMSCGEGSSYDSASNSCVPVNT